MKERLQTIAAVVALVAVGFLLGAFWFEWREPRLGAAGAPGSEASPASLAPESETRPRVEVLNGTGTPGAAERAAGQLRAMGFDVVYFGNADDFDHAETRVLARSADTAAARRVADSLGLERAVPRPEPSLYVDGTIVLGADWDSLMAARDSAARDGFVLHALLERFGL